MNPPTTEKTAREALRRDSTALSKLLRHSALARGLVMDTAGFAAVDDVLRLTGLSRARLEEAVAGNAKDRFEVRGHRIRAVQGHSLEGTPVTLEGLEGSWDVVDDDDVVFHGTSVVAARAILGGDGGDDGLAGIHSAARSHVHLAPATTSVVGKRHAVDVLLVVDPTRLRRQGITVFRAPNGVLLARSVPRDAITNVVAESRAGHAAIADLKALLSG